MMALGSYRFSINTAAFQDLERNSSWRWPSIDRVGQRPALQYVGPGDDTITMRGTIFPHFRSGLGQLSAMRAEAAKGEPLLLIDGTGRNWGKYVITEIREGQKVFFSNGMARSQDFDLTLQMYGEDETAGATAIAAGAVAALASGASSVTAALNVLPLSGTAVQWQGAAASRALLGVPSVRSLATMTTAGLTTVRNAIGTVAATYSSVMQPLNALRQSASQVINSFEILKTDLAHGAFLRAGLDLDAIISATNNVGAIPFNGILDSLGTASAQGKGIVQEIFTDAGTADAVRAMIAARNV